MSTNPQGVGPPAEEELADAVMTFRLTRSQQDHLRRIAASHESTPSTYLRYLVQADIDWHDEKEKAA